MIRILTDSACDILPAEAQQLGVTVIPLNVTLEDGTVLRDGIDMTPSEYYTHLAACRKLPTTSQPSPEQFERLYLDAAAAGDEVLGIFLSDALSGTGQCARLAADLANVDNVVFVNTENVCLGQSLLVRLAVQLRDAGKTITQIAADLEKAKQHLHLVAAVDDLKYLRKGGRLSAAAAVAGGMLGIKPILAVMEGKVALAGKARGLPGVYVALFKKIDEMGGIHPGYTPLLGYTVNHRELQPLLTFLQEHDMVTGSNEICFWNKINNGIRRYKQWSEGNALELKPEEIWPQYYLSEFDLDKEKVARYAEDMAGLWEVTYYHRELRPGVKEALEELKNKGYRLGVISNTASLYSVFDVLEAYGIRDYFEDVTLSSVTGYRKPHPGIFQIALREMKAKAEECAYVGDTLSRDVIGAKRMHFGAAIQIRSFLSSQKDEGVDSVWQPDHVVEKIADIVPYLEKLNGRA